MNQKTIERLLHISFWIFLLFVFWLVYGQFISLELGFLRALVNVLSMAGLYYAVSHLVDKYLERRQYVAFAWRATLMFISSRYCAQKAMRYSPTLRQAKNSSIVIRYCFLVPYSPTPAYSAWLF